jgi:Fe-S-cluster containining protein
LLESEVRQISDITGLRPLSFASRSLGIQPYRYRMKKRNGKCVFLDGKACRIYNFRPLICRFYPFSLKRGNNGYMFEVSEECPGIGLGRTLAPEEFERMLGEAHSKIKIF